MKTILDYLSAKKGRKRLDVTDVLPYIYLICGVIIMFGPIIWLVLSSFKTSSEIAKFPPRLMPVRQITVAVEGYEEPLPLYVITFDDGSTRTLAQVRSTSPTRSRRMPTWPAACSAGSRLATSRRSFPW